jgi:hypothetical protein
MWNCGEIALSCGEVPFSCGEVALNESQPFRRERKQGQTVLIILKVWDFFAVMTSYFALLGHV